MTRPTSSRFQYLFSFLLFSSTYAQLLIPAPKGKYAVSHSAIKLTDTSRSDPYDPLHGPRNVMISLFYPVSHRTCTKTCVSPYMPPATATHVDLESVALGYPKGTMGSYQLQSCCSTTPEATKYINKIPLILLSPALEDTRLLYSAIAQAVASDGYAVATMDHAYETGIVEYPNGAVVHGVNYSYWDIPEHLESQIQVRVADARFVLTQLERKDVVKQLIPGASHGFDVRGNHGAGFIGHSTGGTTAMSALMQDSRFSGVINLDGMTSGPYADTKQPVLLFGRSDPDPHNTTDDASWAETWGHLKGWKKELSLKEVKHRVFMDVPLLLKLTGLPRTKELEAFIGTLDGGRSFEIITDVLKAYFNVLFKGEKSKLLDGKSKDYPELVVDF